MRSIARYLSCVHPGGEFETYVEKPKVSDFLYFNLDVEFGAVYASLAVRVFGFGFKLSFADPFVFSVSLEAPCADVRVSGGLTYDWEKADLLREADDKRTRFIAAMQMCKPGQTIDAADWEHEDSRKQRVRQVRRDFNRKFWESAPNGDIDLGNAVFLVFKEDGVYCEVRPENPKSFDEVMRGLTEEALATCDRAASLLFDRPVSAISANIRDLDGNPMLKVTTGEVHAGELDGEGRVCVHAENGDTQPCSGCTRCGIARHRDIGCDAACAGRV